MIPEFILESALSPEMAEARLREYIGGDIPLLMLPSSHPERPLRGHVRGGRFRVRLNTAYGNSFAAVYDGTIEPMEDGSSVRAYADLPGTTVVVLAVWVLAAIGSAVHAVFALDLAGFAVAVGMIGGGGALLAVGRALARREAVRMREHLYRALTSIDGEDGSAGALAIRR